jgi:hypothetical protein
MKIISLLTLFIFQLPLFAQNKISGRVIDALTKEPLANCNIFINNSTIATSSHEKGDFVIEKISLNEVEIVFRYVGYMTLTKKVNFSEVNLADLEIELRQSVNNFSEVKVSAKRDKAWEKLLRRFTLAFLGNSPFAEECKITNPWTLNFEDTNNELIAKATEPLIIINQALGYEIEFEILTFSSSKSRYKIFGNAKFKVLDSKSDADKKKWETNRKIAFQSSSQYFFKSLIDNKLKENGFELFRQKDRASAIRTDDFYFELNKSIISYDASKSVSFSPNAGFKKISLPENIEVHNTLIDGSIKSYSNINHAVSWITLKNDKADFNNLGQPQTPESVFVAGEMNTLKFSGLLPLDYSLYNSVADSNFLDTKAKFKAPRNFQNDKAYSTFLPEFIAIHSNKRNYKLGESIWFKTYQYYEEPVPNEEKSGVIYVDLFNADRKLIDSKIIKSVNGNGWGEFKIPDSVMKGQYCLRAYTTFMQNFGDSLQSTQEILIDDNYNSPLLNEEKTKIETNKWFTLDKGLIRSQEQLMISLDALPNTSYSASVVNDASSPLSRQNSSPVTKKYLEGHFGVRYRPRPELQFGILLATFQMENFMNPTKKANL